MDELPFWLGFKRVKGIGPAKVRRLLEHFGSLQAAWEAAPLELVAAGLVGVDWKACSPREAACN